MKKYKTAKELAMTLGLTEKDAKIAELKARLIIEIAKGIEAKNCTHQELADLSGVPRSSITGIVNGSLVKVSVDRLIKILFALGRTVEFKIKNAA